jgi:hypothetical protein
MSQSEVAMKVKPYSPPKLVAYGNVATLTKGTGSKGKDRYRQQNKG